MQGASSDSLHALTESLGTAVEGGVDASKVGDDLFGVADVLRREPGLRRVATDVSVAGRGQGRPAPRHLRRAGRPGVGRPRGRGRGTSLGRQPRPGACPRAPRGRRGRAGRRAEGQGRRPRERAVRLRAGWCRGAPSSATRSPTRPAAATTSGAAQGPAGRQGHLGHRPAGRAGGDRHPPHRGRRARSYQKVAAEHRKRLVATVRVARALGPRTRSVSRTPSPGSTTARCTSTSSSTPTSSAGCAWPSVTTSSTAPSPAASTTPDDSSPADRAPRGQHSTRDPREQG